MHIIVPYTSPSEDPAVHGLSPQEKNLDTFCAALIFIVFGQVSHFCCCYLQLFIWQYCDIILLSSLDVILQIITLSFVFDWALNFTFLWHLLKRFSAHITNLLKLCSLLTTMNLIFKVCFLTIHTWNIESSKYKLVCGLYVQKKKLTSLFQKQSFV